MSWRARLEVHYTRDGDRTTAHDRHEGPLRVLRRLYPEGEGICHHVVVHPPGGVVGGDRLEIDVRLAAGAHALITTPGATRFYRSAGAPALQHARLQLDAGARLEWLPLETIAHPGCMAENRVAIELAAGAETIGWDVLALGLPAAGEDFRRGRFVQHVELAGAWRERGVVDGGDALLLDSPLGLAGQRVLATMWFAAGEAVAPARREALLEAARAVVEAAPGEVVAGATAPNERVVVVRALGRRVEAPMALLRDVRAAWRRQAWNLAGERPRVWRT